MTSDSYFTPRVEVQSIAQNCVIGALSIQSYKCSNNSRALQALAEMLFTMTDKSDNRIKWNSKNRRISQILFKISKNKYYKI